MWNFGMLFKGDYGAAGLMLGMVDAWKCLFQP